MSHGIHSVNAVAPRSRFYHGPFGRICPNLEPWHPLGANGKKIPDADLDAHFVDFAKNNMVEAVGLSPTQVKNDDALRTDLDAQFDSKIPAGYTYFGQFVDHDITLDTTPLSDAQVDPNRLHNFRTPRLDLDCVYGTGPDDQPYLYDADKEKLLVGENIGNSSVPDLVRNVNGRAIIGDMRNDENAMVAQIQLAFILAHNMLVQRARNKGVAKPFEAARHTLQWLYQWIVWHDFVARIANDTAHGCALRLVETCDGRKKWDCGLDDVYSWKNTPFMPVEFSVAAYRFGHSMVRNSYQTNNGSEAGFGTFFPIFDNSAGNDLRGFRPLQEKAIVQWDWFLDMETSGGPFPQRARKIDTKLSNALAALPEHPTKNHVENILAARNLVRAVRMQLPSGTDVACKFGLEPLALDSAEPDALWYYILKEAETLPGANSGQMLGKLGSLIVCATFAGLLKGDATSFLNCNPEWTPSDDPLLIDGTDNVDSPGKWELSSVIRLSGLPVDASTLP